jgi:D-glycero-D-manno-heptose 1,7-bisphosphate phosphatase
VAPESSASTSGEPRRRAVFLDRDGTLNVRPRPHDYVRSPAQFVWLPGAAAAIARLCAAGYLPVVVSNQRGVALGHVSEATLLAIEQAIQDELAGLGARVGGFYYCTHSLEAGCRCRKPEPGMLEQAAVDHELDLTTSVMIGDEESDVTAGRSAGCRTIRIAARGTSSAADLVVETLRQAAERLLPGVD